MQRRDFISELFVEKEPVKKANIEQFQNQVEPNNLDLGTGSIANYSGVWGETQVKHLLRRTLFGFDRSDITFFKSMTMSDAVDYLLNIPSAQPSPPINGYNTKTTIDPDIASGATWVNGPDNNDFTSQRRASIYAWNMKQVLNPERHIREKMTVFMHNHFATEVEQVSSPIIAFRHHKLLRENCLGNF
jgi:hypothetical protein